MANNNDEKKDNKNTNLRTIDISKSLIPLVSQSQSVSQSVSQSLLCLKFLIDLALATYVE